MANDETQFNHERSSHEKKCDADGARVTGAFVFASHGGHGVRGGAGALFKRLIICGKTVEFFYHEEAKERRSGNA
jgi:hypothetical protein